MSINIQKAIVFATLKHQNQKRKGTDIPYIVHPMEVMQILTDMRCNENIIIAGILHDTLENTATSPKEICDIFGQDILKIVQSESEDKSKSWKERKQNTINHLKDASPESKIVCFADKFSNIRSMLRDKENIGQQLWQRFNAHKEQIEWYYRSIANVLKETKLDGFCDTKKFKELFKEFEETINNVFGKEY